MRIDQVKATAFGPFNDNYLTLTPGMNLFHGPNEAGKSSWFAALYAGLAGQRRQRSAAEHTEFATRHRPWTGSKWSAGVEITLDDGTRLAIQHDLRSGQTVLTDLADQRELTSDDLEERLGRELTSDGVFDGARLLGLNRQSARATTYIGQADVLRVLADADELHEAMERAAVSESVGFNAAAVLQAIVTQRNALPDVGTLSGSVSDLAKELEDSKDVLGRLNAVTAEERSTVDERARAAQDVALVQRVDRWAEIRRLRPQVEAARALTSQIAEAEQDAPDDALVRRATAALSNHESLPPTPAAPTGKSVADLEAEMAPLPDAPEGPTRPSEAAESAHQRLQEAKRTLAEHVEAAPTEPEVPEVELDSTALRERADELDAPGPEVDPELLAERDELTAAESASDDDLDARWEAYHEVVARNERLAKEHKGALKAFAKEQKAYDALVASREKQLAKRRKKADAQAPVGAADAGPDLRSDAATKPATVIAEPSVQVVVAAIAAVLVVVFGLFFLVSEWAAVIASAAGAIALGAWWQRGTGAPEEPLKAPERLVVSQVPARSETGPVEHEVESAGMGVDGEPVDGSVEGDEPAEADESVVDAVADAPFEDAVHDEAPPLPEAPVAPAEPDFEPEVQPTRDVTPDITRAPDPRLAEVIDEIDEQQQRVAEHEEQLQEVRRQLETAGAPTDASAVRSLADRLDETVTAREEVARHRARTDELTDELTRAAARLAALLDLEALPTSDPEDLDVVDAAWLRFTEECADRASVAERAAVRSDLERQRDERQRADEAHAQSVAERERVVSQLRSVAAEVAGPTGTPPAESVDAARKSLTEFIASAEKARTARGMRAELSARLDQLLAGRTLTELVNQLSQLEAAAGPEPTESAADVAGLREQASRRHDEVLQQIGDLRGRRSSLSAGYEGPAETEELLGQAERDLTRVRDFRTLLDNTQSELELARDRARANIAPAVEARIKPWLPRVTRGRYSDATITPGDLRIEVTDNTGVVRKAELLSHGTTEQIFLLLRVALAQVLSGGVEEVAPIVLDDVTVQSDHDRTHAILELLHELSAHHQVVLFTQEREVIEWAERHLTGPDDQVYRLTPAADLAAG